MPCNLLYFTFYYLLCQYIPHDYRSSIIFQGEAGWPELFPSQWSIQERKPWHVATSNQICPGNALEYLSWKVERERERDLLSLKSNKSWTYQEMVQKWLSLENRIRSTEKRLRILSSTKQTQWQTPLRYWLRMKCATICAYVCVHAHTHRILIDSRAFGSPKVRDLSTG